MLRPMDLPFDLCIKLPDGNYLILPKAIKLTYVVGSGGCGFWDYLFFFYYYSFVGWFMEATYRSFGYLYRTGKFKWINTGFLTGPICPIYGSAASIFSVILTPFLGKVPIYALLPIAVVFADAVEYITSLGMEKIFNTRWWDYSKNFLNINGRICFKHTVYWGIASFVFLYMVHPIVLGFYAKVPKKFRNTVLIGASAAFVVDLITTVIAAKDVNKFMSRLSGLADSVGIDTSSIKARTKKASRKITDKVENRVDKVKEKALEQNQKVTDWTDEKSHQFEELRRQYNDLVHPGETVKEKRDRKTRKILRLINTFENISGNARKLIDNIQNSFDDFRLKIS